MPSKKSYIEFAADIKKKYPAYKNIDDLQLAKDIVAKYPAYSEIVSFEQEKFDTSDLSLRNRPIFQFLMVRLKGSVCRRRIYVA